MAVVQLEVTDLLVRLGEKDAPFLLDVREPHEFEYARIEGSELIPLNQIPLRFNELDPLKEVVVICHHGIRSQQAAFFLDHQGFKHVLNLAGGIDAWSRECDPNIKRY